MKGCSSGPSVITLLRNRFYLLILAVNILFFMNTNINSAVGSFFAKFILHNDQMLGVLMMAQMIPMIVGLVFTPALVKKFGIYKVNLAAMGLSAIFCIPFVWAGYQGNVTMMLVLIAIRGLCGGPMNGTLNALIAQAGTYSF